MQDNIFIQNIAPFSALDPAEINKLSEKLEEVEIRPGELIIKKGEGHDSLFYISRGKVRIVNERYGSEPVEIDTIQEGAVFGDEFIYRGKKAKFTYICNSPDTRLIKLPYKNLAEFFTQNRLAAAKIKKQVQLNLLKSFINSGTNTYDLNENRLEDIIKESWVKNFKAGEYISKTKEKDDKIYVLLEGIVEEKNPLSSTAGKKRYGGEILGKISADIGKDIKNEITALALCEILVIKKIDLILFLFEQEGFEESLDKIISERQPKDAEKQAEEKKKTEILYSDEEIPEYHHSLPLKTKLGFYPGIKQQSQMDCGAACIVNVCKYYGKSASINYIRELAKVGKSGASMLNILLALKELGFRSTPMLSTYEDLQKQKTPSIVNWKGYHWIVVYKITGNKVIVADPGQGRKTLSKEEFTDGWTRYTLYVYPGDKIQTIEESKPSLHQFSNYFQPYKKNIFEILLASLCLEILNIFLPLFTKFIIDKVIVDQKQNLLVLAIVIISAITLIIAVLTYIRERLILYVSLKVNTGLIGDFFDRVLNLPLKFFEDRKTGDITTRFQENEKITNFMTNTGLQVFLNLFTAVLYLALMFYLNASLTTIIAFFILLQVLIYYFITPKIRHTFREVFEKNAASESHLIESLSGISTIKIIGIENPTRWQWENLQIAAINSYFKTIVYGMVSSLASGLVNHLSDVSVLFFGALFVLNNRLSIGGLVAFTIMAKGVSAPIIKLATSWNVFQGALNSVEKLNDVLESKPEIEKSDIKNKQVLPSLRGYIRTDNLTFRYSRDSQDNILQNVTLEVEPGQRIAFVGRSGSGKSTLIKLLYGFYKPTSGNIFVDGFGINDVYLPSLRKQIGLVPQENDLFKGTIRDNIAKSKPHAPLAEIIEAAKLAGAHEFISSFPEGYDTALEERGSNISGGQRQRIAIARTFIQKPQILILDEATSALDNESERKIQNNIETHLTNTTVFMIAHRLSTVKNADQIFVIDKGNIIENGTHRQLLENRGLYYYLANQQLSL